MLMCLFPFLTNVAFDGGRNTRYAFFLHFDHPLWTFTIHTYIPVRLYCCVSSSVGTFVGIFCSNVRSVTYIRSMSRNQRRTSLSNKRPDLSYRNYCEIHFESFCIKKRRIYLKNRATSRSLRLSLIFRKNKFFQLDIDRSFGLETLLYFFFFIFRQVWPAVRDLWQLR